MVRCYRESYYLLEHATDNVRLLKSVNSTQISKMRKDVEEQGEYESDGTVRKIHIPETLAPQFFESNVASTLIGSLVEFVVDEGPKGR
jgi:hypothetical protein